VKKNILLIGTFPPPISGVSLANLVLRKGLQIRGINVGFINTENQTKIKGNTGSISLDKFKVLISYFQIYKIPFYRIVNITIGQTFFGVCKYLPFLLITKIFRIPTIVHLHGGYLKNEFENQSVIKKKFMLFTLNLFDYGIVLSESLTSHLSFFLSREKIFICKNFFQDRLYPNLQINKNYSEVRLIFLSNLIEGKGINLLLKALESIDSSKIKVRVAGNIPPENEKVKLLMQNLTNVEYLGVVEGKEKIKLLEWGNVFCLPTFYDRGEGQPISIIEAMAFGSLILTTKHGGIPDICTDKNAIFVKKNDVEDLRIKINEIINHKQIIETKGILNKDYANKNFKEEIFISSMIKIFEKCRKN
tara:strand:+ start:6015 stop:7097 length:1083 start_codon:yes stop_codon:yes gene_type:complete